MSFLTTVFYSLEMQICRHDYYKTPISKIQFSPMTMAEKELKIFCQQLNLHILKSAYCKIK
jgi:hypothetical protein